VALNGIEAESLPIMESNALGCAHHSVSPSWRRPAAWGARYFGLYQYFNDIEFRSFILTGAPI
jgi:hypothetical protein